jgi:phosphatidylserine/phosphatidylglycerophosphate/cardiolipin synthase-like enzyme
MPSFVLKSSIQRVEVEAARRQPEPILPELVSRSCSLEEYEPVEVPSVDVSDEIIAYTSPDSTYAVTRRLMDGARKSILIGIYDFSAPHVTELLSAALARGVSIKLMLDIDSKGERKLFDELIDMGIEGIPAPSCASERVHFFRSSHEKVIVIDGEWCLVQSGNYSTNSIPLNVVDGGDPARFRHGNRDTGLAIRSKRLAAFFTKILDSDMALEINAPEALARVAEVVDVVMVESAPKKIPDQLFPSKLFKLTKPLTIQPVLSPDNYMDVVPDLLRQARKSILIEQQYIRAGQDNIKDLLAAMKEARDRNPKLDIRIILGKIFNQKDIAKEKKNLDSLKKTNGLKLGTNIRYIDTDRFVHCHNKMILIDGKGVLVSSQNWSSAAVSENREAGLWLEHSGICRYFTDIFESDWSTARKKLPGPSPEFLAPEALSRGGFVRVVPADYREV